MQQSKEVCTSESLSTFSIFPRLPGLSRPPASRQSCPLPAAFPGKRGRRGGGHPAEASLSPSPFPLALLWVLPGQARRRAPAPRGAARGTSGRPRRQHLERPRRIPGGRSWRVRLWRCPGRQRDPAGEGGRRRRGWREGAAQVTAARSPRSPAAERAGVKAGRAAAGHGGGMSDIAGWKDNTPCLPWLAPRGTLLR